jgi:hypothetical protein
VGESLWGVSMVVCLYACMHVAVVDITQGFTPSTIQVAQARYTVYLPVRETCFATLHQLPFLVCSV